MSHLIRSRSILLLALVAACGPAAAPTIEPTSAPTATAAATAAIGSQTPAPPTPAASPQPSATPEATQTAIETDPPRVPDPGLWAQNPPTPFLMSAAVQPYVATLNIRKRPSTSAAIVGTVDHDNILRVSSAPIQADGYIWYFGTVVSATGSLPALPKELLLSGEPTQGWFAAGKGDVNGFQEYVLVVDSRCPDTVNLAHVVAMLGAERLACFGNRSITLEGTFGCQGCMSEIYGYYEPDWLTNPNRMDLLWKEWMESGALRLRFPPKLEPPPEGVRVSVQGRFANSAADDCAIATAYPWAADQLAYHDYGAVVSRALCRQEFVVEAFDVL